MEPSSQKVVKAKATKYQPAEKDYFKTDQDTVSIDVNQSLIIKIECDEGFSVFIPFGGIFHPGVLGDQVFNAELISPANPEIVGQKDLWQVSIQRLNQPNPHPEKTFAYCIYIKGHDDFAVAASPPKMNVNP